MDINKVCLKFNINWKKLQYYEKMGVIRFTNEYSDNEIQKMSDILTLEKIGLSSDLICMFLDVNVVKKIDILNQ